MKIIGSLEVTALEHGTDIAATRTAESEKGYELGQKLGLPTIAPLDENGNYIDGFNWLTGKNVNDVLDPILEDLKKKAS